VASIIDRNPDAVSYGNLVGQTPLHMAAGWPWAVQFLLQAGANLSAVDHAGILPLSYACFFGCHEAVKMLLAAGSPLSSPQRPYTVLDDASTMRDVPSFVLLATTLAQRRIRLLRIARRVLPTHNLDSIVQSGGGILDYEAKEVIQVLHTSGVRIDPHYWCFTDHSIYHTENLLPDAADVLYKLGFSNVEGRDRRGLTTLGSVIDGADSKIKIVPWLVSKGAHIQRELEPHIRLSRGCKAVHFAAAGIGDNLRHIFVSSWRFESDAFERYNDYVADAIRIVLGPGCSNCYDYCDCLCSQEGCSPLTMILKHFAQYMLRRLQNSSYPYKKWSKYRMTTMDWILETLDLGPPAKHRVGQEALRLLLFDELDLTHTCCRPDFRSFRPSIDEEEAQEVVDEESDLIVQFETLCERAELEWDSSSERFSQFLRKFIQENVSHRRYEQRRDEGYAQGLRSIGVQLEEVSDDEDGTIDTSSDDFDAN
jgi:hypothetical protein